MMAKAWLIAISVICFTAGLSGCAEPLSEEEELSERPPYLPAPPPSLPGQPAPPAAPRSATAVSGILPTARYSVATSGGFKLTESAGGLYAPSKGKTSSGYTIYSGVLGVVISDKDVSP